MFIVNSGADQKRGLAGVGVLITRPRERAIGLKEQVLEKGGVPFIFPTLEISFTPADILNPQLQQIRRGQILIFVSANAVEGVFQNIDANMRQRLSSTQIAAVGESTKLALLAQNQPVAIVPNNAQQNTEGLLSHPVLQELEGQNITIVRAQSGRETLREHLQARGAKVAYLQSYVRAIPAQYDAVPIIDALVSGAIQIVLLSSYNAFVNLMQMLGDDAIELLAQVKLIVPSERVAELLRANHGVKVIRAEGASNEAMLEKAGLCC